MRNFFNTVLFAFAVTLFVTCPSTWAREKVPKPVVIYIGNSPTISFSILHPTYITLSLLPSRDADKATGYIYLTKEGCIAGYKGKLDYAANDRERLFSYFSTETPWSNTGSLIISQDKETRELSVTLNGETLKVQPQGRVKFLRVEGIPSPITIDNVAHANN